METGVVRGKVDWKGRAALKHQHGGTRSSIIVLVAFGCENTATMALAINAITYFTGILHMQLADAADNLTNYLGTCYFLTIIVAVLADTKIGRFKAGVICACIEFFALTLLAIQAHLPSLKPAPCNVYDSTTQCEKFGGGHAAFLFIALYILAIGTGGIKATLPAHGADQFDPKDPKEATQMSSFFNYLLLAITLGSTVSLTLFVWIQEHRGWDLGFTLSAVTMFIALMIFIAGLPTYRMQVIDGTSVVVEIIQVFVAAARNRNLKLPDDPKELYEIEMDKEGPVESAEFLPHRDVYRFLDKAAIRRAPEGQDQPLNPWKLCRVTQVENAKIIFGMVPVFLCTIIMTLCLSQLLTFSIMQGQTMDTRLGNSFKIPPASLLIIPLLFLIIIIPLYDRIIIPILRKITGIPTGITHLQRVGVGLVLASISMTVAAIMEARRKEVARAHHMVNAIPGLQPLPISVFWLSFQFFIFGIADLFTYVGLLEFFYSEAPKSLKSVSTCFMWSSMALGYFLSSILVKVVNRASKDTKSGGWLAGNNINRNHLNLFFWLLAGLSLINFIIYLFVARRYKYRPQESATQNLAYRTHPETELDSIWDSNLDDKNKMCPVSCY